MVRIILLIISMALISSCAGVAVLIGCAADPAVEPKPEQNSAKFSFSLKYHDQGISKKYEGILVCKYKGRACDGRGRHNDWTQSFTSGESEVVLRTISDSDSLYYPLASCQNLMAGKIPTSVTRANISKRYKGDSGYSAVAHENLNNKYGIILDSAQYLKLP